MTAILRLNPALRAADYAEIYAREGYVQVHGLFEPETAHRLGSVLEQMKTWDLVHSDETGGSVILDRGKIAELGRERIAESLMAVTRRASSGFGYVYLVYPMINMYLNGHNPGGALHTLTEFLNGREFLDFGAEIIGQEVVKADAQATLYRPGDFLNLHDDTGEGERRAAYTIGFTRTWRPDWGGQLLFHDAEGDIRRGLRPGFNLLTLFKTPQPHSVAPVAPYAAAPRLSIAGWLRNDPPISQ